MIEASKLIHSSNKNIKDYCSSFLENNIAYASIGLIEGKCLYSAFTDNKWQEIYVNLSLHHHDPSFNAAIKMPDMPIFWDMVPRNTKKAAIIMRQRCEMMNIVSGVTMSFKSNGKLLVLTMGAKLDSQDFVANFNENIISKLNIKDILCN